MGYPKPSPVFLKSLFFILLSFIFVSHVAAAGNQFITIVNPLRLSRYTKDPLASVRAQYQAVEKYRLPATWLLTYDILDRPELVRLLKSFSSRHELGIFLEVSEKLAKYSGAQYNPSASWHFAKSVFTTGYHPSHRKLIVDTLMEKFKSQFGYYPKSVGAWWIDSFSLEYLSSKYGVSANLGLADQFDTDGYQVWGQYWSTAFYPSKYHAGIPASHLDNKIDIVTVQWAPRDPLRGYDSSLYSTQDYFTAPQQGLDYFQKLVDLYSSSKFNSFGQLVIGLEGDFSSEVYTQDFSAQMKVAQLTDSGKTSAVTLSEFAKWYKNHAPALSPSQVIVSPDILGQPQTAVWYQSPRFRLGILINTTDGQAEIRDFRIYYDNFQEPYYWQSNSENKLFIYLPSIIDSHQTPSEAWPLPLGKFQGYSGDYQKFEITFTTGKMIMTPDGLNIYGISSSQIPSSVKRYPGLVISQTPEFLRISPASTPYLDPNGWLFSDWTSQAMHALKSPKFILGLLTGRGWDKLKKTTYHVSQAEIDTLTRLSLLPAGKVMVANRECLQCGWNTPHQPAVFANHRGYVRRFSRHPVISTDSVFQATDRTSAKKQLDRLKVKYIYVVKYGDYIESLPFSPGDLNVEKIHENANTQLWIIKKV